MPEIPNITSREIRIDSIQTVQIPTYDFNNTSQSIPTEPPVVVNIGVPVVDIPGCVEAHESNSKSKTVGNDDQRGLVTYCDSGVPSYNPINFEPNQIVPTAPSGVDTRKSEKPKPPGQVDLPNPTPPATAKVDCPTASQQAKEPVGTYVEGFRKKVTEYKLIGNECVQITEAVPLPQQIVPTRPSGVDTRQKEKPEPPGQVDLPNPSPPATAKVDCPTPAQEAKEPVGTMVEGFRKKVVEYKLMGNECVQITESVPLPQQIVAGLPSGCLLYTSPSPRDRTRSRMPSSA